MAEVFLHKRITNIDNWITKWLDSDHQRITTKLEMRSSIRTDISMENHKGSRILGVLYSFDHACIYLFKYV